MAEEKNKSPTVKKTSAAKKPRKQRITTHPPYFQMIKEALMALKEKNGSSPYAIAKKIEEKHKSLLPENFRKTLSLQLKNSVVKGKLMKIRASYKLSETTTTRQQQNNNKKRNLKQEEREKKMTTRSSSRRSKKTVSVDKQEKKKRAKKVKQPKFIKSSAGKKKALKASAT